MKILLVGATGRVGEKTLPLLLEAGYEVIAASRRPSSSLDTLIDTLALDLTASQDRTEAKIAGLGIDVILNVSGSRGGKLLETDLFGFVKLQRVAEKLGIKRFIQLSSIFALEPERWTTPGFKELEDYYIVKHFADFHLVHDTKLDWTILRPGYLTEKSATGKIAVNDEISAPVAIEDVATTLLEIVKANNTIGKIITMHTGEITISEAISAI
ncbi:MAG: NAD(P)H-binding protein [Streptococcaceae bacterium]|jgi:uncharacterized protein YbjT (DUF2867 family)|nr:NAD(P)H-binding protein [Streptococcaceae bacterium]